MVVKGKHAAEGCLTKLEVRGVKGALTIQHAKRGPRTHLRAAAAAPPPPPGVGIRRGGFALHACMRAPHSTAQHSTASHCTALTAFLSLSTRRIAHGSADKFVKRQFGSVILERVHRLRLARRDQHLRARPESRMSVTCTAKHQAGPIFNVYSCQTAKQTFFIWFKKSATARLGSDRIVDRVAKTRAPVQALARLYHTLLFTRTRTRSPTPTTDTVSVTQPCLHLYKRGRVREAYPRV
ncbi:hypothetical protein L1887_55277 [Cichorium endivia]|nr:hypothetical protein L1887_55277 [Cichorium endivia]